MDDRLEELIREIATKHGIVVARDDPILVLQTMNYRLLQESAQAQQAQLDRYKQELEALAHRWSEDVKGKADRIIESSLSQGTDAMGQVMHAAAKTTAAAVAAEVDAALSRVRTTLGDMHGVAILNLMAACVTMGAACVALWAALK